MRTALIILSISSIFVASYIWIRCPLWASPKSMAQTTVTHLGFNKNQIRATCGQKADSVVAFFFLALGSALQATVYFLPTSWDSFQKFGLRHLAIFVAALVIFYFFGNMASRRIEKNLYEKTLKEAENLIR